MDNGPAGEPNGNARNEFDGDVRDGSTVNQFGIIENATFNEAPRTAPEPPVRANPGVREPWVDRKHLFARMSRICDEAVDRSGPLVFVVEGDSKIGRTAMVNKWVEQEKDRFPDGTFWCDAGQENQDGSVSLAGMLRSLLRQAKVDLSELNNGDLHDLKARWRSQSSGKRLVIVLDDLEDPGALNSLLPNGNSAVVIVVSRRNVIEFIANTGAEQITVDRLDNEHGLSLVEWFSGPDRIAADPAGAEALVDSCDGRPAALRMVGATLRARPGLSITELRREYIDTGHELGERLLAQSTIVEHSVSHNLSDSLRRLLRRLTVLPSHMDFDADFLGWMHNGDDDPIDRLKASQLVTPSAEGRWRLADAVADHDFTDVDDDVDALELALTWMLASALNCDERLMGPDRFRLAGITRPRSAAIYEPVAESDAQNWFMVQLNNLRLLQQSAFEAGRLRAVWQLEEALWVPYQNFRPFDVWNRTAPLAVEAARRDGGGAPLARMLQQDMNRLMQLGEYPAAERQIQEAIAVARGIGNERLKASTIEFYGVLLQSQDRHRDALAQFFSALGVNQLLERHRGAGIQCRLIGRSYLALDVLGEAEFYLDKAFEIFMTTGESAHHAAHTMVTQAELAAVRGRAGEAVSTMVSAADRLVHAGSASYIPTGWEQVGNKLADNDAMADARDCWNRALSYHRSHHNGESRAAQRLQHRLAA